MVSYIDFSSQMPSDVLAHGIAKELSLPHFAALAGACKKWHFILQPNIESKLLEVASFGRNQWLSIPGVSSVSGGPVLTEAQKEVLIAKLKSNYAFFNKPDLIQPHRFQDDKIKRTWQTHKLIFFPETINGQPRTINSQNKLFHFIKEIDNGTAFEFIIGMEGNTFRNQPAPKSYWALVTMDIVPGSRGTDYATKERLLTSKGYKVLTPNDAITSNLLMNLGPPSKEKKGYFFGREEKCWTYTATTELYNGYHLAVGAASSSGPSALNNADNNFVVGVAGVAEVP